ncbi:sugar transferase [Micromonospora sp. WMMD710]|uniref:sugar transferase n=1 Tax=Micromonospora sp. WMMD710 TaxID=3016085 RepID=UPI002416D4E3|nr:sugar transferase [Micromonospora sp. WMMD710]MDG4758914.1 sugar transferase [Micromonospora sp. WMMD710]
MSTNHGQGEGVSMDMQRRVKRLQDIVLALLILILTLPVLVVAALLVRIQLGSPILFTQERTGQWQLPIRIFKIRTMSDERDAAGDLLPDGLRCGPVGRTLRRLSIDELPQLINVLRGDLSLVGPRPLLPRYDAWYDDRERRRFDMRPGITGLAQVHGRNSVVWDRRLALDVRYVEQWNLWLDLRILAATVSMVLTGRGVAVDPSAEMLDLDKERELKCAST